MAVGMNHLAWFSFPGGFDEGFNFVKIRYQRNPNDAWRNGFGVCICNVGFAIYWDKR